MARKCPSRRSKDVLDDEIGKQAGRKEKDSGGDRIDPRCPDYFPCFSLHLFGQCVVGEQLLRVCASGLEIALFVVTLCGGQFFLAVVHGMDSRALCRGRSINVANVFFFVVRDANVLSHFFRCMDKGEIPSLWEAG